MLLQVDQKHSLICGLLEIMDPHQLDANMLELELRKWISNAQVEQSLMFKIQCLESWTQILKSQSIAQRKQFGQIQKMLNQLPLALAILTKLKFTLELLLIVKIKDIV